MDPTVESANVLTTPIVDSSVINPATLVVGAVAIGILAVAGTGVFIYYEDLVALAAFWVVLGGVVAAFAYNYVNRSKKLSA